MPISLKQQQVLAFPYTSYDAIICDGAIRSGKTVFMTIAFIEDAMRRFHHCRFGICGRTVDSAVKNIIEPYLNLTCVRERYSVKWKRSEKQLILSNGKHENCFEIFGGKDESSYTVIQGRTLAGILLDEVALQPRSFVEQAMARCSVEGSRLWFNCNPESPNHWFYQEWVKEPEKHHAIRLRFSLEDNPALSESIIKRYKSMYSGVFYRRYILGEWCMADGLVYQLTEENLADTVPMEGEYYISVDYGTLNPFSAGLWCVNGENAVRVREYYYNGRETRHQLTDEQYCDAMERLAGGYPIRKVIVDPSAASFIAALRQRGFTVVKAENGVLDGIRWVSELLRSGRVKIHRRCEDCIREFGLYRWDASAQEDRVIKENDHAMDDMRYFCATVMKHHRGEYKPLWVM